ncbi:uncharacterized protein LOC117344552 [Pecten maximus]|uniref:uncharacterized protein LOC117344552 n=1 Tax=Pecten maximus TaxID=6579 RepID=UPI0014582C4A|nr:uncharacterized protein LOC117344552 [Pecten maximus]
MSTVPTPLSYISTAMILLITWIILSILPLHARGTVSIMKRYTLLTAANFTWNDAKLKCESIGSNLAKVDSETERFALNHLDDQAPWNSSLSNSQYWLGLHIRGDNDECTTKTNYFWHDCEPLFKWTNWAPSEPNECGVDYCIRLHNVLFKTRDCGLKYGALCEADQAGDCTFDEVYTDDLRGFSHKKISLNVDESACKTACLDYIVDEETQCWLYQIIRKEFDVNMTIIAEHPVCYLFFTTNSYSADNLNFVGNWTNATTIYVKRCYEAILDDVSQPDSADAWAGVSEPNTTCPVIGDCYFETIGVLDLDRAKDLVHTTLDVHGTEQECKDLCMGGSFYKDCWFLDTFSPLSRACRLYFLHNDLSDTFNVLDLNARKRTLFMKKCLKEELTTTTVPTTTTTPQLVFEQLRVEKKVTGNYRRKFISIYEDRPSAYEYGYNGRCFHRFYHRFRHPVRYTRILPPCKNCRSEKHSNKKQVLPSEKENKQGKTCCLQN